MKYKGYTGRLFEGIISSINNPITFQGKSVDAVIIASKDSIDDYIGWREK